MKTIRFGILATGDIAARLADTIATVEHAEVLAVGSRNLEKAEAFAKAHNIPRAYASYEELCSDPDVDIIYIATPHSHHYENMLMCIEHGKHILCEKSFTVNADQAKEVARLAKEKNIHTCLDTSGITYRLGASSYNEKLDALMEVTDLVMLDIKHIDPEGHKILTGHDNAGILAFARYLEEKQVDVWIRHVVVPGVTDDEDFLTRLGTFLGTLSNVKALDVLPYHIMGITKYEQLDMDYPLKGVPPATKEQAARAKKIILTAYWKQKRRVQ